MVLDTGSSTHKFVGSVISQERFAMTANWKKVWLGKEKLYSPLKTPLDWNYQVKAYRNSYGNDFENEVEPVNKSGWAITDAGPDEDKPGIYMTFSFQKNKRNIVAVSITEQDLLDMLYDIQGMKRRHER
jgi:hypothetical protein